MKILKYVLISLLVLAAVFFLIGIITPSVSYQAQIEVAASKEKAWSIMSDDAYLSDWLNGYQRSELLSGTEGAVGAVSNIYFIEEGKESVIQETITGVSPEERMAMSFSMEGFMDMDYEFLIDGQGDKTSITTNSVVKGHGLFSKSMVALMKGAMKSQEEENLGKLKTLIES